MWQHWGEKCCDSSFTTKHRNHVESKPLKTKDYTMESDILKKKKK
jgi:hypothetical protein